MAFVTPIGSNEEVTIMEAGPTSDMVCVAIRTGVVPPGQPITLTLTFSQSGGTTEASELTL